MNACYRAAACKPFLRTSSHKITPNSMLGALSLPGPRYERPGKNYEALDGKNCHSLGHDQKPAMCILAWIKSVPSMTLTLSGRRTSSWMQERLDSY